MNRRFLLIVAVVLVLTGAASYFNRTRPPTPTAQLGPDIAEIFARRMRLEPGEISLPREGTYQLPISIPAAPLNRIPPLFSPGRDGGFGGLLDVSRPTRYPPNPETPHLPGELIVNLPRHRGRCSIPAALKGLVMRRLRLGSCVFRVIVPAQIEGKIAEEISREPGVIVDFNYLYTAEDFPNDPLFPKQWMLYDANRPTTDIDALAAWEIKKNAKNIVVAVLDTGIDLEHPDLRPNIWINSKEKKNGRDDDSNGLKDDLHGWDFVNNDSDPSDDHGHGTHISGIIAAVGNNGIGISGVVPGGVAVLPVKVIDGNKQATLASILLGLQYAIKAGAHIVNASFSGPGASNHLAHLIQAAADRNVLVVTIAGNDRKDIDRWPVYPARFDLPNIITVAATDEQNQLATADANPTVGSSYGKRSVDLAAPGKNIFSTIPQGTCRLCDPKNHGYAADSGTSQAAPVVAGALALGKALAGADAGYKELKQMLLASVDPLPVLKNTTVSGGRLNLLSFLKTVQEKMEAGSFSWIKEALRRRFQ